MQYSFFIISIINTLNLSIAFKSNYRLLKLSYHTITTTNSLRIHHYYHPRSIILTKSKYKLYTSIQEGGMSFKVNENDHLPVLPKSSFTAFGKIIQEGLREEVNQIVEEITANDESRDQVFAMSRLVLKNTNKLIFSLRTGGEGVEDMMKQIDDYINQMSIKLEKLPIQRDSRWSQAIEKYVEAKIYYNFFISGELVGHSKVQPCNDEEYISALLGFAQELPRYVTGRAGENDIKSIKICQQVINQLNGKMLEFDFRNGNLRRKYDGLKYSLKTIEEILFELSLINDIKEELEPPMKLIKVNEITNNLISIQEIDDIKIRMEKYDIERENVIKQSREIQKLAKQAIYSIHRNTIKDAQEKIDNAKKIALRILDIIHLYPTLRDGSFSNSLEEYAEAILFMNWYQYRNILTKEALLICNTHEYIGALSDFTGEIGRMAILFASQRNIEEVENILQADLIISLNISQFNTGNHYTKKLSAVQMNLKKIEDVLYDLKLQKMGGKALRRDIPPNSDIPHASNMEQEE